MDMSYGVSRGGARCYLCGNGAMVRNRVYRLSGPAVFIGWLFLIPSLIGITLGVYVLSRGSAESVARASTDVTLDQVTIDSLRGLGVPERMVTTLKAGEPIDRAEIAALPKEQRDFVSEVSREIMKHRIDSKASGFAILAISWLGGLFVLIGSIVGGLFGWLLTMKKNVLQCRSCSASVDAA